MPMSRGFSTTRSFAGLLLLQIGLASGCATPTNLSFSEIALRHNELEGHRLRVVGWLRGCQFLSCGITSDPGGKGKWLSLGASKTFDRDVAPYNDSDILIEVEGTVGGCFIDETENGQEIEVCTDRADNIKHPRLVQILKVAPEVREEPN